ncbi:putative F-box/LRR-repeat protein [Salvia divinorum]|uniref:F-box/LRR-repeat protein n=1 Tax=Salvia divinorum TaxID=28513 RepID=A0ABD1HMJ2_SALDI
MNLPLLEEAYLNIYQGIKSNAMELHNFVRMLRQLSNATTVTLTLGTLKVFEQHFGLIENSPPPMFPNIKCLRIPGGHSNESPPPFLLKRVMDYMTVGTLYFESLIDGGDS